MQRIPYIYQQSDWPHFTWDTKALARLLAAAHDQQGHLLGQMESLGFHLRAEAMLHSLTEEIIKSNEIEGCLLDREQVRSSVARHLGMETAALAHPDRDVEGVVDMMLDATEQYLKPLSAKRLFDWHAALFPTGRSGMHKITVGAWRTDKTGPMQVVSGPIGHERVHYEAPPASALAGEMRAFFAWFNRYDGTDLILRAGIAHLWFVTIHPFGDGNGRIARAIANMALARSEKTSQRFYSLSAQIQEERSAYYNILEETQKGDVDITLWLDWFLGCLGRALGGAETILSSVLAKARFWERHAGMGFNERQKLVINRLLDGFEGKLTSSKWAKLAKCSQDTAGRDIDDLLKRGILAKNAGGGRSTSYSLVN